MEGGLYVSSSNSTLPQHIELFQFCLASSSVAACVVTCFPSSQSVELTSIRIEAATEGVVSLHAPPRPVGQPETIDPRELYTKHYRALVAESHCLDIEHRH